MIVQANQLFETDPEFQDACLQASRWVMTQKVSESEALTEKALRLAVKYFLAEIPLFADTASIMNQTSSVFCYHQRVGFLERFYERQLALLPSGHQGFLILQPIVDQVVSSVNFDSIGQDRVAAEA